MASSVTGGGAHGDGGSDQPAESVVGSIQPRPAGERRCRGGDHSLPCDGDLVEAGAPHAQRGVWGLKLGDAPDCPYHAAGVSARALLAGALERIAPLAQIVI